MAARRRWAPTRNVSINRSHPLGVGLVFCAGPYSGWRDLVYGIQPVSVATVRTPSTRGEGASLTATVVVTYPAAATPHLDFTSAPFSVLWAGTDDIITGYPVGLNRINYVSETVNQGWTMGIRGNGDAQPGAVFQHMANNALAIYGAGNSGNSVVVQNVPFTFLGTSTGAPLNTVYVNGVFRASSTKPVPVSPGAISLAIGGNDIQTNQQNCIWNRALSAKEAVMLDDDPYCFLRGR